MDTDEKKKVGWLRTASYGVFVVLFMFYFLFCQIAV